MKAKRKSASRRNSPRRSRRNPEDTTTFPTNRLVEVQAVEVNEKGVVTRVVVGDAVMQEIATAENRRRNRKRR